MLPINSSSSRNCAESFACSKNILFFVMRLSPKRTHQALPEGECGIRTERRAHSHLRHCLDCVREMQLCECSGPDRHDLSAVVLSQVSRSPEARCSAPQPKPVLRTREASGNDKDPCFVATRHRYNIRSTAIRRVYGAKSPAVRRHVRQRHALCSGSGTQWRTAATTGTASAANTVSP